MWVQCSCSVVAAHLGLASQRSLQSLAAIPAFARYSIALITPVNVPLGILLKPEKSECFFSINFSVVS